MPLARQTRLTAEYVRWNCHKQVGLDLTATFSSFPDAKDFDDFLGMKIRPET
ncbi:MULTISPECIES: hypothetical protein [Methylobacteriaceae]